MHLEFAYPDARMELNRWLPIVKWMLAIPHYIILFFLSIGAFFAAIGAWFAILFTGRYPRGIFDYIEGVVRWHNRVVGYVLILLPTSTSRFGCALELRSPGNPPDREGHPQGFGNGATQIS